MKKNLVIILFTFLFIYLLSCSQGTQIINEYNPNINKVINSPSITYYGVDMSILKLTNPEKIGQDEHIRHYLNAWISTFERELPPEEYIAKWLKKDHFTFEPRDVQKRTELVGEEWIIWEDYSFTIDKLKEIIKSYELKKDDGLGFVINIENFNKPNEYISAYFTFFDIQTREILWASKIKGEPGGWGMNGFWSNGLTNTTKVFIDKNYKPTYKEYN